MKLLDGIYDFPDWGAFAAAYALLTPGCILYKRYPLLNRILATVGLLTPFLTDLPPLRAYLCFASIWFFVRNTELINNPKKATEMGLFYRFLHLIFYADLMQPSNRYVRKPVFDAWLHGRTAFHIAAIYLTITYHFSLTFYLQVLSGWFLLGNILLFLDSSVRSSLALLGVLVVEPLVDEEVYWSRSIKEFWQRENKVVQPILQGWIFDPLRKRNVDYTVAMMATFLGSGIYHAYPCYAALGFREASGIPTFFAIHASLMFLETRIFHIRRWNVIFARLYTWGAVLVTLPFILRGLKLVD